jgi:hypothetical protein
MMDILSTWHTAWKSLPLATQDNVIFKVETMLGALSTLLVVTWHNMTENDTDRSFNIAYFDNSERIKTH